MGRGWIQGFKDQQAAKKGLIFTKLSKEISVAARLGGPDPSHNARLRGAMEDARKASMPRDNIERAIKKGAGLLEGMSYEDVIYEGYGPNGVAVLVEALTDNRNRTVSDLRTIFRDHGGNLGESNSVQWMFNRVGIVEGTNPKPPADLEGEAIEVNAQSVEAHEGGVVTFTTDPSDLESAKEALATRGWSIATSELGYEAKTPVSLEGAAREAVLKFLGDLQDNEDVRRVHATLA